MAVVPAQIRIAEEFSHHGKMMSRFTKSWPQPTDLTISHFAEGADLLVTRLDARTSLTCQFVLEGSLASVMSAMR